jgi:hypothetical protein
VRYFVRAQQVRSGALAGPTTGVLSTLQGVEASKFVADPMGPVCTENLSSGVVVVKSAKDSV